MSTSATIPAELKAAMDAVKVGIAAAAPLEKLVALQAQVDAIDVKIADRIGNNHSSFGSSSQKSLRKSLEENESVSRLLHDRKGRAIISLDADLTGEVFGRKSIISNITSGSSGGDALNPVGSSTSGVLLFDRTPGITPEARQTLRIRDLLSARPTTMQMIDFVKVSSPLAIASPVAEGSIKPENSLSFASVSEKVRLLATWIPATRQVLDDMTELMGFLKSSLPYYIDLEEELQLLSGDGTSENLHGLLPQATAFNAGLLPSAAKGWNKIDVVAAAIRQVNAAKEIDPSFCVLHTNDWWDLRVTKDGYGRYIFGDPQSSVRPSIFGLDVVPTTSIAAGTFLVGSGNPAAAEIRDRMETQIEISTEHDTFFTRNLVAIRCEKRLALVTKRPASFVSGTFTTSPS